MYNVYNYVQNIVLKLLKLHKIDLLKNFMAAMSCRGYMSSLSVESHSLNIILHYIKI